MSSERLPPKIQEQLAKIQQLQNTLQSLLIQKQRLELELSETERALKALESIPEDAKVYKAVGTILVEKSRDEVFKELSERKEFLEMRSKVLARQETKTRERLTALQRSLQRELGASPPEESS
ncbi:MAG TPA: prefoldin subunit beta [Candidatus Bathyarchaeota archaeon]|nr:prefoldin subunit beta [Candidatus Bathyarchaeota archaeon]RLI08444.1 MAG: prefoldin subunit beta [Candidatus Bathyarchaeota archaeon]HDI52901.1 prefoldin subunit beta [Candidatus Bathyarchaeota archaeon]